MGKNGETRDYVLEESGISPRQFKRWREKVGVLPSPIDRPSRGHARGRGAIYPPGTAELAAAIKDRKQHTRTIADAGWWLWCEGRNELTGFVRDTLRSQLGEAQEALQEGREAYEEERDEGNPVRRATKGRPPWGLGWLRGTVGKQEFSTPVHVFVLALTGELDAGNFRYGVPKSIQDALRTLLEAFAIPRPDRELGEEQDRDDLLAFSDSLNVPSIEDWLSACSDAELLSVRDEARRCFRDWAPSRADEEPIPLTLFALTALVRQVGSEWNLDQPLRRMAEFYLNHDHEDGQRLGRRLQEAALNAELPPGEE